MAASETVPQHSRHCNFVPITPRHGVITLFGYGIKVHVDRGHLTVQDGIGPIRREARLPRVRHGLRRLVVIGADGMISLAALRWLDAQDAAFLMLERDGSVLITTGPVRPSDSRLRRAQSLAHESGIALEIARELIRLKLAGQERLVRESLHDSIAAEIIAQAQIAVSTAETVHSILQFEARAAHAYWSAWRNVAVVFPKNDLPRVPEHWRTFGSRQSPLTGSPRLAVNPPNAILNYLYALLESESRLALAALGLDPGIGVLHVDAPPRDSLACDLMEAVRPQVDAYLLNWITREPLRREWFFEKPDGNCRLMASFAVRLSETVSTWGRAVAPIAEGISRSLWSTLLKPARQIYPATRLTQNHKRQARGSCSDVTRESIPRPLRICRACGVPLKRGKEYCASCAVAVSRENLIEVAKLGRVATHSAEAEKLRSQTQRRHRAVLRAWQPSQLPDWLNEEAYREKVQPHLAILTVPAIALALGVSQPYATDIRAGKRRPHPRHWRTLARLVGVSGG